MDKLKIQVANIYKRRELEIWLAGFFFILASPYLFYYGYCRGWWGRHSLLLQYYFQCQCPAESEQTRYPKEVEVIVSACQNGGVRLSPSGRYLSVREKNDEHSSTYLLDLQTKEKIDFTLPYSSFYFLTDNLLYVFVYYVGDEYVLDRITNTKYPIRGFIYLQPKAYSYGKVDPPVFYEALLQADQVFITDYAFPPVIVLFSDFRTNPEHSFTFDSSALPGNGSQLLEQFLRQNNIDYDHNPATFPGEIVSPDDRFIARYDGIYVRETGEKIVEGYSTKKLFSRDYFSPRGWLYDSSAVIYSTFLNPCVIDTPGIDEPGCIWRVPQPVLLLKVPGEYLSSIPTP